jgi:hypothetical protein
MGRNGRNGGLFSCDFALGGAGGRMDQARAFRTTAVGLVLASDSLVRCGSVRSLTLSASMQPHASEPYLDGRTKYLLVGLH